MARGGHRKLQFGLGGGGITRGALYLLFALAGCSLVFLVSTEAAQAELASWLIATDQSVWGGYRFWQLVTSPLIETNLISLLFEGLMLWMFLPALERWWGAKRFLIFAAYTSIPAVAVGTLVGFLVGGDALVKVGGVAVAGTPVNGLDPFIFAGIAAYGVLFSKRKVQFFGVLPMTGKQLAIGISLFTLAFILIGQAWADGAAMATAMLIAVGVTSGKLAPKLWWLKWKQKRIRRHLKVVPDASKTKSKKKYLN